jgi:putative Mg2+ transporter-C (MgtC) family protein
MDIKIELLICMRLLVAFILGAIIGVEREMHGNAAGIRTFAAVTLGAALFTLIGIHTTDPTAAGRIVANIVTGIGFLGAGIIYKGTDNGSVLGLTTASSIWAAAAVGAAVAYDMYVIAILSTALVYFLLSLHHFNWYIRLKSRWRNKHNRNNNDGSA